MKIFCKIALAGAITGCVNGVFGAGGGMILVPMLTLLSDFSDEEIFPASISIILPMCVISIIIHTTQAALPWAAALPYLTGSLVGGILAGLLGKRIPTLWLHRALGVLILYGGWRYLR